jgi:DNA-binding GntR family transcriptional regulator
VLENEGLLTRHANKGCTVTSLTREEIVHIYRVRLALEPLAAQLAVANAANSDPKQLKAALAALHAAANAGYYDQWRRADLEFHQTLWRLAGNPYLDKALSTVAVPFFAFAGLVFQETRPTDLPRQAREHDAIVQAILSADPAKAYAVTAEVLGRFEKLWTSGSPETRTAPGAVPDPPAKARRGTSPASSSRTRARKQAPSRSGSKS